MMERTGTRLPVLQPSTLAVNIAKTGKNQTSLAQKGFKHQYLPTPQKSLSKIKDPQPQKSVKTPPHILIPSTTTTAITTTNTSTTTATPTTISNTTTTATITPFTV